jgi:hypothetical protein
MTYITHCSDIPFIPYPIVALNYLFVDTPIHNEGLLVPANLLLMGYDKGVAKRVFKAMQSIGIYGSSRSIVEVV